MASTGLSKTFSSSPTNNKKGTMSFWIKKSAVSSGQQVGLLVAGASGGTAGLYFDSASKLYWWLAYTGSWQGEYVTNRQFRDPNAWYHIVQSWDTTQGTASDRMKLYVNGVQETSFQSISYPGQDQVTTFGNATAHYINYWNNSSYFDGSMSHFHYTDGYAYAASDFGSFDSTTGEWKINTSPSVSYGTNGFFILKDGNSVTDASPNSNDWAVSTGTLTKTEDCPSNVFCTMNPLVNNAGEMMTLTKGNLTLQSSDANWNSAFGTLGMTSGKYYWEIKFDNAHNVYNNGVIGSNIYTANTVNPMNQTGYTGFYNTDGGEIRKDNVVTTADYGTYSTGDIMGVACDMDNYTITFYKNGVSHVSNVALSTTGRDVVFPASVYYQTNSGVQASYNFGNGYFGTTAVSSAGTNASNNGIFEYDVPTGYTALSTKGLNL